MNSSAPPRRFHRSAAWLIALSIWLVLALTAALLSWHLRQDAITGQARELDLLSLALTHEIDRGLRGAEEGLLVVRAELQDRRLSLSGDEITQLLHARSDLMLLVHNLWLVDPENRTLAASNASPAPPLHTFSSLPTAARADTVSLSRLFVDPATQETMLGMALRFHHAPGSASGWIIAAIPSRELLGAFSAAHPAADASMAVLRGDGSMVASANFAAKSLDAAGSQHLMGLHRVPRYDMQVLVSRDMAEVLAGWRQTTEALALALALLLLVMAVAVHFVQRAERRRSEAQQALQAQVTRASRLESLGTLAGGVAHDFNNVLAGIVGFGEMAQEEAPPGSDQARHLDRVLTAALRGKALVERVLSFSRGGARTSTVFELEPVVEEVLTLLSGSLRAGVVLERGLAAPGGRLRGDPTQAFEAVMNLCTNAMQAMPAGGMLSVQTERVNLTSPRVLSHSALPPGSYLSLSVADQGQGITPQVMEHLFEPFFTTRGAKSGTGLGLAVVHGVVTEFGGAINVTSQPGQGALFTLYLPECFDPLGAVASADTAAPAGAGQKLLVVDDEPTLVAMAEEMLTGLGYAPVGFTDPTAALAALRADPDQFAAIITDEVMPGLTGTQFTETLRSFAPRIPVLLVSGYGGALLAQRATAVGITRVMTKPLRRADLARTLADMLR